MDVREETDAEIPKLAGRLHQVASGVSIGIGYLRAHELGGDVEVASKPRALPVLEEALTDLKGLLAELTEHRASNVPNLIETLERDAARLEIELQLHIEGEVDRLPPNQMELARLFCREALRNVHRHAGSPRCRIELDLNGCPIVIRARDWGAGVQRRTGKGTGLQTLSAMADGLGFQLLVGSSPGFGTQVVLRGPPCGRLAAAAGVGSYSEDEKRRHKSQKRR